MLKEVVTPEMMKELQDQGLVEFVYASSACSVRGIVTLEDELVRVIFTPHGQEDFEKDKPGEAAGNEEKSGKKESKEKKQKRNEKRTRVRMKTRNPKKNK